MIQCNIVQEMKLCVQNTFQMFLNAYSKLIHIEKKLSENLKMKKVFMCTDYFIVVTKLTTER